MEHLIEHHRANGPGIYVEASDLAELGVRPLVAEMLDALGLSENDLDWIAPAENQEMAIDILARMERLQRR